MGYCEACCDWRCEIGAADPVYGERRMAWQQRLFLIDNQPAFHPALRSSRRVLKSPKGIV